MKKITNYLFLNFLGFCSILNAQSTFFFKFTPDVLEASIYGQEVILQGNDLVVFVAKDSFYFDDTGEEQEKLTGSICKYTPNGNLIWEREILSPPYFLPQINNDALIANDSFIYLSYNFLAGEFTQPGAILKINTEGDTMAGFYTEFDEKNEFFGNLYFYNNQILSISEQRLPSVGDQLVIRIFSPNLDLQSEDGFALLPIGELTTYFASTILSDNQLVFLRSIINLNSLTTKLVVGNYDLINSIDTIYSSTAQAPVQSNFLISNRLSADTCIVANSTFNTNELSITTCYSTLNNTNQSTLLNCETPSFLSFVSDGTYLPNGDFITVGNAILTQSPTPESPRVGFVAKYDAIGTQLWQHYILDTLSIGAEPNSVEISACYYDQITKNTYLTGSSTTTTNNISQSSLILGVIDQNGCVNGNCGDTIFIQLPTSNAETPTITQFPLKVSPNPTNGLLQLSNENTNQQFEIALIQIKDLTGHILLTQTGNNLSQIDISTFPVGLYVLQVTDSRGQFYAQKIVKAP
jgi:Secretion system C-terminal sorting domain